jgi:hypothetical protein
MRGPLAFLLGIALSSVPACSFLMDFDELQGGSGDAGSAACNSSDPASVAQCLARVFCKRVRECAGPMVEVLYTSDSVCTSLLTQLAHDGVFAHVPASVADGYLEDQPSRLAECAARVESTACSELALMPPGCPSLFRGRQASGAPCRTTLDCVDGLVCNPSATCPSQCEPRGAEGAPCTDDDHCQADLRCMETAGQSSESCRRPAALDAPCGGGTYPSCELGLYCLGASDQQTGTCKEVGALFASGLGESCNVGSGPLCEPGLYCLVVSGRCVPESTDQTCALAVPDQCPADYACNLQGGCELLPTEGQLCNLLNPLAPSCRGEAICAGSLCRNLVPIGGDCASADLCFSGYCDPSGKCAARPCQ